MSANDQLADAIRAAIPAAVDEAGATPGMVMTDYVVVAATRGWSADGDPITQVVVIPEGPGYAISGLLHEAVLRMDADSLDQLRD